MAKFDVQMPDEFIRQLERLENFDNIAKEMLNTAAPILVGTLKHEISNHYISGSLYNSITASKPKKNDYGYYVTVGPKKGSKNEEGIRNGEVLAYLEYGTSRMSPKPVFARANSAAESRINALFQEVFDREVGAK